MSETPTPTKEKQEAYQAFIEHYNLNPSNNDAIMNCLFELNEENKRLSENQAKLENIVLWILKNRWELEL